MIERIDYFVDKLRFVFVGILAIALGIGLLWVLVAGIGTSNAQAMDENPTADAGTISIFDGQNAVTGGIATVGHTIARTASTTGHAVGSGVGTVAVAITKGGRALGHGTYVAGRVVGRSISTSVTFTARTLAGVVTFAVHVPADILESVSNTRMVSAVIKPTDHNPVPIIDPHSPALVAAQQALPSTPAASEPASQTTPQVSQVAVWPIHGIITTEFGVPELPYQAIHTGLDISDGRAPGITPITAFRHGTVIATEHTGGLGNHVIVDHGNGVTSVYGHLNSISVAVGQEVDTSTTLGYEGTTGVSTGPHLHFEIRINGQATNPHQFIAGQP